MFATRGYLPTGREVTHTFDSWCCGTLSVPLGMIPMLEEVLHWILWISVLVFAVGTAVIILS